MMIFDLLRTITKHKRKMTRLFDSMITFDLLRNIQRKITRLFDSMITFDLLRNTRIIRDGAPAKLPVRPAHAVAARLVRERHARVEAPQDRTRAQGAFCWSYASGGARSGVARRTAVGDVPSEVGEAAAGSSGSSSRRRTTPSSSSSS
jgi:hypothetical protein